MIGLLHYVMSTVGMAQSPYIAAASLPPAESMRPPRTRRISGTGTALIHGTIHDTEQNKEVMGSKWYGEYGKGGIAHRMMRDPHVRRSLACVTDPISTCTWGWRPASKSPIHKEHADFLDYCLIECLPFDKILKRIITAYMRDGAALVECLDDLRPIPRSRFPLHRGRGIGLVPTELLDVGLNTVAQWWPVKGRPHQLKGVTQYLPYTDTDDEYIKHVSAKRLLRFTLDQEGANFAGFASLRSVYGSWRCKLAFLAVDAIKHERRGVGTPYIILPEEVSDEDIQAAEKTLAMMRANEKGYAIFPHGFTFSWDTGNQSDGTDLERAIQRCNIDIAVNVAAGFQLLSLATGGAGSNALSSTQQTAYHLSVESHTKFIGNVFTFGVDGWSLPRRLLELNYGPVDALPTLQARNLPTRNWLDVMPQLINATNAGLITADDVLEDELREIFQVPERDLDTARETSNPGHINSAKKDEQA